MPSFFTAYVQTALSYLNESSSKVWHASDIEPETMAQMKTDCERFCQENVNDLAFIDAEGAGRGFWLTRNRVSTHDIRVPGTRSARLTEAAEQFGPYRLIVDGKQIIGEQG